MFTAIKIYVCLRDDIMVFKCCLVISSDGIDYKDFKFKIKNEAVFKARVLINGIMIDYI